MFGSLSRNTSLGVIVLGMGVALASVPAAAAERVSTGSVAVQYTDLDLDVAADVAQLHARLERAAREVCGPVVRPHTTYLAAHWRDCVSETLNETVAAVDRPLLSTYHASRTSRAGARRDANHRHQAFQAAPPRGAEPAAAKTAAR